MASENGSCFKKLLVGCGCMTVLLFLFAAVMAMLFRDGPMETAEMETIALEDTLGSGIEQVLNIPQNDDDFSGTKPIIVKINVSAAQLTIVPDGKPGVVSLDGEYDTANFDLETNVRERDGAIVYSLDFSSRRFMNMSSDETDNELVLHLPRNQPIKLDIEFDKGLLDADFSGLALTELDADLSMGRFEMRMATPNPITARRINFETSMGELSLDDFQNFRAEKGRISANMGAARLYNSGDLTRDTKLDLDADLAEIYLQIPENAAIRSDLECKMGEASTPIQSVKEGAPVMELRGKCFMGGIRVTTGRSAPKLEHVLLNVWADEGIGAAVKYYEDKIKPDPSGYKYGRHSLRGLGYKILEMGHPEDALAIFELNAREYPDYEKTWRALGAAQIELGNYAKAIEHLEKALAINPDYSSAERLLEKAQDAQEKQEVRD